MLEGRESYRDTRAWIRSFPALASGAPPSIGVPLESPIELFVAWLEAAVHGGVPEPHAAALSTVDADGGPDTRFLILKDVSERGFWFSGSAHSPKGRELAANPLAALTFYWREHGRQVRVRGTVARGGADVTARDFLERSVTARAVAAASRQSEVLGDPAEYREVVDDAATRIGEHPDFVAESWRAWCLVPDSVEFWQADPGRRHVRWLYRRGAEGWSHSTLWP